jgi:ubiquitin-protein ligase
MENLNKITIKRINGDFKKFTEENPSHFDVYPNPDNILEIFFLLVGRENTPYEGGLYIGKIVHSPDYPRKAPDYYVMTPNGRFEVKRKICLTNSAYHQADWAPAAWNLITLLEGFSSVWHSDIKEDKILVHTNYTLTHGLKMSTKTNKKRWVPLNTRCQEILSRQNKTEDFIFPYNRYAFQSYFYDRMKELHSKGLIAHRYRPYDLRHTAISRWIEAKIPVAQAAKWAGNSSEVIWKHYVNVTQDYDMPVLT